MSGEGCRTGAQSAKGAVTVQLDHSGRLATWGFGAMEIVDGNQLARRVWIGRDSATAKRWLPLQMIETSRNAHGSALVGKRQSGTVRMAKVTPVRACRLRTFERRWDWPDRYRMAIDAHWGSARQMNPGYFDGEIFVLGPWRVDDGVFDGELVPARFREHLFWRAQGFPMDAGVSDGFGSALVRSAEGHVVLGRQGSGNLNSGLAYMPSGFIDRSDIEADGVVTIDLSVARELAEETGLGPGNLDQEPGYFIVECGAIVSIACPFRSRYTAEEIVGRISRHVAAEETPELVEAVVITGSDYARGDIPEYTRVLLDWLYRPA